MKTGIERIAEERARQIEVEGYTVDRDRARTDGGLADAAARYADLAGAQARGAGLEELRDSYIEGWGNVEWPWDEESFKPSENPIRNLEKAGALIAAEIDRLQNQRIAEPGQ